MIRGAKMVLVATAVASCSHLSGQVRDDAGAPGEADAAPPGTPTLREAIELDAGWKFVRSEVAAAESITLYDGDWTSIDLPHTWNAVDGQEGGNAYHRGPAWYRRHL